MSFLRKLFGGGGPSVGSLSTDDYHADYFQQANHTLIDVRTSAEFKTGHIAGAKNIPLDRLEAGLKKVPKDKPVVLVCRSGSRSRAGGRVLINAGYEQVFNLKGGTVGWELRGNPLKK